MPYGIFKDGSSYKVYKVDSDGNKVNGALGTHETRQQAANQIAAIEANEGKSVTDVTKYWKLSQAEAGYVTTPNGAESCAGCRWFDVLDEYNKCKIVVDGAPYPIVASGYCNRFEAYPVVDEHYEPTGETLDPSEPMPFPDMEGGMRGIFDKLKKRFGWEWLDWLTPQDTQELGGFKLLDDNRFMAWWTNNFKDFEEEIISEYAIDEFIKSANSGDIPMPELWWMHIPGTKHGMVDKLFHVGHFAIAVGHFDNEFNPLVKVFKNWYTKQKRITMSHGFMYRSDKKIEGVYYHIRTYEISALKAGREANPFTNFEIGVEAMALVTEAQRLEIEKEFGKDVADFVINQAETQGKLLEKTGIAYKAGKKPPFLEDDDEDMDKPKKSISDESLIVLATFKQMSDESLKVIEGYAEQVDATRKEAKDNGNRISQLEQAMGGLNDKMNRITQYLGQLTTVQPRASKSSKTVVPDGDIHTDFIIEQNERQNTNQPIFNQMKAMTYGNEVIQPNFGTTPEKTTD